jgi:hypothetical protein
MKRTFLSFALMTGALAAQAVEAHAESMRFLPQAGANVMAQGDIDASTVAAFNAYKNAHPGVRRVAFDSAGGSVLEALALGRAIRQAGLNTYVGGAYKVPRDGFTAANLESMGECYSACVWAFAGGVHRFFDATGGVIGVHQFEFVGDQTGHQTANEGTAQYLMTAIGLYLDEMGVSRTLLDWAALVPPNTIQPLPRAMAERFLLDNIGDRTAPRSPQANSATDRSELDQTWPFEWHEAATLNGSRYYVARGSLVKGETSVWFKAKINDGQHIWCEELEYDSAGGRVRVESWLEYDQTGRWVARSTAPSGWFHLSAEELAAYNAMVEVCYRAALQVSQ